MEQLSGSGDQKNNAIALYGGVNKMRISVEKNLNMLDDNLLKKILENLHASDLIKMEKVCKKWKNVCRKIWSEMKTLEFNNFLDFDAYDEILSRCGRNLTSFSYSADNFYMCSNCVSADKNLDPDIFMKYNRRIIPPIVKYCQNLNDFLLCGLDKVDMSLWKSLASCSFFKNVTALVLSDVQLTDKILEIILKKARRLHTFSVNSTVSLQGRSLMKLSRECVTLIISGCCCLQEDVLGNVLKRLLKLVQLGASSVTILSLRMLTYQSNLEELYVGDGALFKDLSEDEISNLCFPKLKKLYINSNPYVTDYVLSVLSVICPNLEELDLSDCYSSSRELKQEISSLGISHLVKLSKLKLLKLNGLMELNFDVVVFFAKGDFDQLKTLECQDGGFSSSMTYKGLFSMAHKCPKLEVMDLRGIFMTCSFLINTLKSLRGKRFKILYSGENPELLKNPEVVSLTTEFLNVPDALKDKYP